MPEVLSQLDSYPRWIYEGRLRTAWAKPDNDSAPSSAIALLCFRAIIPSSSTFSVVCSPPTRLKWCCCANVCRRTAGTDPQALEDNSGGEFESFANPPGGSVFAIMSRQARLGRKR